MRYAYKTFDRILGRDSLEDTGLNGMMIQKWLSEKQGEIMWTHSSGAQHRDVLQDIQLHP
jgi:hypothetical protein